MNFVLDEACKNYLGVVPKQKCDVRVRVTPELEQAVEFYCALEREDLKRRRLN